MNRPSPDGRTERNEKEGGIEGVLGDGRKGQRMNGAQRDRYKMRKDCVNVKVCGGLKVLRKDEHQDGRMNEGGKG